MQDFDLKEWQPYIFILLGLGSILLSIFKKSDKTALKVTGHKAEGIIFALGYSSDNYSSSTQSSNVKDKVTIRFVTKDNQWITGDLKQDFAVFFSKQYKEGDAVDIYYDPLQPSNFFVDTKQSDAIARKFFTVIGFILCAVGIYQLLVY
jgi:hypothetical protein